MENKILYSTDMLPKEVFAIKSKIQDGEVRQANSRITSADLKFLSQEHQEKRLPRRSHTLAELKAVLQNNPQ